MLDLTKPVQTRDGRKVEIISTNSRFPCCNIMGYIGIGYAIEYWNNKGIHAESKEFDLVNVPVKRVAYFNIYDTNTCVSFPYIDRKDADYKTHSNIHHKRIACIRVEYTEGQFDE